MWRLIDLLEDLVSLQSWLDRALLAVQGRMDDAPREKLLARLRNTAGCTTEETTAFKRVADRLERQLQNRISV